MTKAAYMKNGGEPQQEFILEPNTPIAKESIQKQLVLDILERGEKPTKEYVQKHLQQYNITSHKVDDLRTDILHIFPEDLSHDDIKLLANMYEDIGTYQFRHPEFFVNFKQTHDSNQQILDNALDAISLLIDRQTVKQLMLGTKPDLLHNLSQTQDSTSIAPKIHPLNSKYTRKKGPSDQSHKMAA